MTEEQSGHDKSTPKTRNIETDQNTREAAEEREGMGKHDRSALPKTGLGEKPEAGYWDQMRPEDSSDMSMNKSRFGVFEKEGGSGPAVIKPDRDFGRGKDPRSLNQSGVYAEKDAEVWKEMAKSGKDTEWCGTPSDESCETVGASTGASSRSTEGTGKTATVEESAPTGKQGQHWRGEPWAKNPKIGGKETTDTGTGPGTSGQHWRGDELPPGKKTDTKPRTDQDQ